MPDIETLPLPALEPVPTPVVVDTREEVRILNEKCIRCGWLIGWKTKSGKNYKKFSCSKDIECTARLLRLSTGRNPDVLAESLARFQKDPSQDPEGMTELLSILSLRDDSALIMIKASEILQEIQDEPPV